MLRINCKEISLQMRTWNQWLLELDKRMGWTKNVAKCIDWY